MTDISIIPEILKYTMKGRLHEEYIRVCPGLCPLWCVCACSLAFTGWELSDKLYQAYGSQEWRLALLYTPFFAVFGRRDVLLRVLLAVFLWCVSLFLAVFPLCLHGMIPLHSRLSLNTRSIWKFPEPFKATFSMCPIVSTVILSCSQIYHRQWAMFLPNSLEDNVI